MPAVLLEACRVRGRTRDVMAAVLIQATSVRTWQSFVSRQGLTDEEAAKLLVAMVLAV